jgi:hypothetical protein
VVQPGAYDDGAPPSRCERRRDMTTTVLGMSCAVLISHTTNPRSTDDHVHADPVEHV